MIIVTDYDKVDVDDFYLTDEQWIKDNSIDDIEELRELAKNGELYYGYEVDAENYAIYLQMDSGQVFIDDEDCVRMTCEGAIIGNKHKHTFKCD